LVDSSRTRPVALVTGSGSGIGAATSQRLALQGCDLVLAYGRNADGVRQTARLCEATGARTASVRVDVAVLDECRAAAAAAITAFGRLDILINNAGTTRFAAAADLDALDGDDFARIFAVNVTGAYLMIRAAAPALRQAPAPAIVNVSSHAGFSGFGSSIAYAASKGALNTMTLGLARALAPSIRVNAVCPGFVDTNWMLPRIGAEGLDAFRRKAAAVAPLRQTVRAQDVADAVGWLALSATRITGQLLVIDAGTHLAVGDPIHAEA